MTNTTKHRLLVILFIIFFAILSSTVIYEDDSFFNLSRIIGVTDNLKHGNFYPFQIYSNMLEGAGYASPLFYGDFFLQIPALMCICGISPSVSLVIFDWLIISSCYFSMMYVLRKKTASSLPFWLAFLYATSSFFMYRMFCSSAIASGLCFVFIPLVFDSFAEILNSKGFNLSENLRLCLYLTALLLSHNITTLLTIIILTIWWIYDLINSQHKLMTFKNLAFSGIVFLLLSAHFIFPLLEQSASVNTKVSTIGAGESLLGDLKNWSLPIYSIFVEKKSMVHETGINIIYFFNITLIGILILRTLYLKNKNLKKYDKYLVLIFLGYFFRSELFPIEYFQSYIGFIQFPDRITIFINYLEIIYLFKFFTEIKGSKPIKYMVFLQFFNIMLFCFPVLPYLNTQGLVADKYDVVNWLSDNGEFTVGMGEYLPNKYSDNYKNDTNFEKKYDYTLKKAYNSFSIYSNSTFTKDNSIEIPITYYKGYEAKQNNTALIIKESAHGLIEIIPNESDQPISVCYKETSIQSVTASISYATLMMIIILNILFDTREKYTNNRICLAEKKDKITP